MNKQDFYLIIFLLIFLLPFLLFPKKEGNMIYVYRKNTELLRIPLTNYGIYEVEGKLGTVQIVVDEHGVMVEKETSPKHLCSKQGYIHRASDRIICLPNEITVEIKGESELDGVIR